LEDLECRAVDLRVAACIISFIPHPATSSSEPAECGCGLLGLFLCSVAGLSVFSDSHLSILFCILDPSFGFCFHDQFFRLRRVPTLPLLGQLHVKLLLSPLKLGNQALLLTLFETFAPNDPL
jgi:hypothetical protein